MSADRDDRAYLWDMLMAASKARSFRLKGVALLLPIVFDVEFPEHSERVLVFDIELPANVWQ